MANDAGIGNHKSLGSKVGPAGIQITADAADPTDSELADGRISYKTGVGFRLRDGGAWYTAPIAGGVPGDAADMATEGTAATNDGGVGTKYSRADHVHKPDYGLVGEMAVAGTSTANSAGTGAGLARVDHVHALGAHDHTAANAGGDYEWADMSYGLTAAMAANMGAANDQGSGTGVARIDHVHDIFDANTPETTEPDTLASTGSVNFAARRDHRHQANCASATSITGSNSEGTSSSFARADHDHAIVIGAGGKISTPEIEWTDDIKIDTNKATDTTVSITNEGAGAASLTVDKDISATAGAVSAATQFNGPKWAHTDDMSIDLVNAVDKTLAIGNSGAGNCNVTMDGTLGVTGDATVANLITAGLVDGVDVSAHAADTSDPHGAAMTVSTSIGTPKWTHTDDMTIDLVNAVDKTLAIGNSGAGNCNVTIDGTLGVTGDATVANLVTAGLVDGVDVSAHAADTSDPHGAAMTVSTSIGTPKWTHTDDMTIDLVNAVDKTLAIGNSGAGNCNVTIDGTLGVTGDATVANLITAGLVDGVDVSAHAADTSDPHGAAMTVSTSIGTPKWTHTDDMAIDLVNGVDKTLAIGNSGAGNCNVTIDGTLGVTGDVTVANLITAGLVDGIDVSAHAADTSDPHGAAMTVSTSIGTPKWTHTDDMTIDLVNAADKTLAIGNSGAGICNVTVDGAMTVTGDITGANIVTAGLVDGVDVSAHAADTSDPHGADMSVSSSITTPKLTNAGNMEIDCVNAAVDSTLTIRNTGAGFNCNIDLDGSITMAALETVDGVDISVLKTDFDTHTGDSSDPHGAAMTVSTSIGTPKWTHTDDMTIDLVNAANKTLTIQNTGAGVCDVDIDGNVVIRGGQILGAEDQTSLSLDMSITDGNPHNIDIKLDNNTLFSVAADGDGAGNIVNQKVDIGDTGTDINLIGIIRPTKYQNFIDFDEGANAWAATTFAKALYTLTTDGANGSGAVVAGIGGWAELDTSALANSWAAITFTNANFDTNQTIDIEWKVKFVGTVNANPGIKMGIYDGIGNDFLYFEFDGSVDVLNIYLSSNNTGAGVVQTDTTIDLVNGTWHTFRLKVAADETFTAYIDGTVVAAAHAGTIRQLTTFKPYFYIDNSAAAEQGKLDIDFISVTCDRL